MLDFLKFKSRLKEYCKVQDSLCPTCSQSTNMLIFENYDSTVLFGVPAGEFDKKYFALCPKCSATFFVTAETARLARANGASALTAENLTPTNEAGLQ